MLVLVLGCEGKPRVGAVDLAVAPNPEAPLTARLRFSTDRPARTRLAIDDGERRTEALAEKDYATDHEVMVLGLRPGRRHRVEIAVEDEAGRIGTAPAVEVSTAPLPADFPEVEVLTRDSERMEPGVTVLSLIRWSGVKPDAKWGALVAYDDEGDVVWYYKGAEFLDEARPLPNGHLLTLYSDEGQMLEMDMLGTIVRRWHTTGIPKEDVPSTSIAVDADTFHHDVCRTPSGNLLVLSSEVRRFDDYPSSETDPRAPRRAANVVGDVLIELTPDGKMVGRHRFFDLFDPYLLGYGSLDTGFWARCLHPVRRRPCSRLGACQLALLRERRPSTGHVQPLERGGGARPAGGDGRVAALRSRWVGRSLGRASSSPRVTGSSGRITSTP